MTDNRLSQNEIAEMATVKEAFLKGFAQWLEANPEGTFEDWLKSKGYRFNP